MAKRRENERIGNAISIKDSINELIETYKLNAKFDQSYIRTHWEEVMGTTISSRTKNINLNKGILTVVLESPALRHELTMAKSKVKDIINAKLGKEAVKEVKIL